MPDTVEPGKEAESDGNRPHAANLLVPVGRARSLGDRQPKGPKSPRRRGNGQGRESHADPAPSVSGDSSSGILLPQASRQQLLKDLPAAPQAPKPALPSSQVVEPSDRLPQGVQDLMQMLAQQKEELPASVKELLEAQLAADHKQTAKQLHRLVTQQSQARRSLES